MKMLFAVYWKSEHKVKGYLLLLSVIVMLGLTIAGTVYLNDWRNDFYNAIEKHDITAFWPLIGHFTIVASGLVILYAYTTYATQILSIHWRTALTKYFQQKWLNVKHTTVDNPDQRISEDCRKSVEYIFLFGTELVRQLILLVIFCIITWNLSRDLFQIPGLLLYISLGYALIGSVITWWLGRPLINIEFETQKREADYRYGLALERPDSTASKSETDNTHWDRYMFLQVILFQSFKRQKIVNFFTSSYNQIEVIIPFLFIAPSFFASALTLGWLLQTVQAMSIVQQSISYIVNNYADLARMQATVRRLTVFNNQLDKGGDYEPIPK